MDSTIIHDLLRGRQRALMSYVPDDDPTLPPPKFRGGFLTIFFFFEEEEGEEEEEEEAGSSPVVLASGHLVWHDTSWHGGVSIRTQSE